MYFSELHKDHLHIYKMQFLSLKENYYVFDLCLTYSDKNISIHQRNSTRGDRPGGYDVILSDYVTASVSLWNRFTLETLDELTGCYKFWCCCCLRCKGCSCNQGEYV